MGFTETPVESLDAFFRGRFNEISGSLDAPAGLELPSESTPAAPGSWMGGKGAAFSHHGRSSAIHGVQEENLLLQPDFAFDEDGNMVDIVPQSSTRDRLPATPLARIRAGSQPPTHSDIVTDRHGRISLVTDGTGLPPLVLLFPMLLVVMSC